MQNGKDTTANYLCLKHGFTRFAFADSLKDEVSEIFGLDRSSLDSGAGKEAIWRNDLKLSVRDLLIVYGEIKRKEDPCYFIKLVLEKIRTQKTNRVVISDFRYPLEYEYIQQLFPVVTTARVVRDSFPKRSDASETALDNFLFDFYIDNSKDIEHLHKESEKLVVACCD